MFKHNHYVPVLRWKEAERHALRDLSCEDRAGMTPLIEIPPKALAKGGTTKPEAINQGLAKVATELIESWGDERIFIDLNLIPPEVRATGGSHPLNTLFLERPRFFPSFIPVTGLHRDAAYQEAVKSILATDSIGLCLRLKSTELASPNLDAELGSLLSKLDTAADEIDLIVDQGLVAENPPSFAETCERLPKLQRWRSFTVVSGAFPKNLTGMSVGEHILPRWDWRAWRDQVTSSATIPRLPAYGDYVIQHPTFEEPRDNIKSGAGLNFSASIRYAAQEDWVVMRGEGVFNEDGPGFSQWPANAMLLCERSEFQGGDFCAGDRYIEQMAAEVEKNGNGRTGSACTWLQAAFNHHLALTVRQIANLPGS